VKLLFQAKKNHEILLHLLRHGDGSNFVIYVELGHRSENIRKRNAETLHHSTNSSQQCWDIANIQEFAPFKIVFQ